METTGNYFECHFSDDYQLKLLNLSDGKLRSEDGRVFHIHKFVLAKYSKYFYALFCGLGCGKEEIVIPGIKGGILSNILSFIYTGNIYVTPENIFDLIVASDYLLLDELLMRLKVDLPLNLTLINCVSIFVFAQDMKKGDISWPSFRFVQMHFESIVHTKHSGIYDMDVRDFVQLLCNRNLCIKSERTIWLAIINWVETDSLNRLPCMPDLLVCLAICDLNESVADEILQHNFVMENPHCQTINQVKSIYSNLGNLAVLKKYLGLYPKPLLGYQGLCGFSHRQATKLHYISCYNSNVGRDSIEVYLTYDEMMDLWRKVVDINNCPQFLLFVNECIYTFGVEDFKNYYYDIIEKEWFQLNDFTTPRNHFCAVELNGLIYILGGISEITGDELYCVEVYDYIEDEWFRISSMIPVSSFLAVTHDISIYVIGNNFTLGLEMVFQVYNQSLQTWELLPSPSTIRYHFGVVVYHGKIFVIGGSDSDWLLKDVEVFDPIDREWSREVDLPNVYYNPKAIVLDDNLIVYDDHHEDRSYLKTNPPVVWNLDGKCWQLLGEQSFMNKMYRYQIFTIEDEESISDISKENREFVSHFENSPFI